MQQDKQHQEQMQRFDKPLVWLQIFGTDRKSINGSRQVEGDGDTSWLKKYDM